MTTRLGERDLPDVPIGSTSTPTSARRGGHLKRLSLSSSPASPPPSSPGAHTGRHTPRHLRLSLAGSPTALRALAYNEVLTASPAGDAASFAIPEKASLPPPSGRRSPSMPASPILGTISEDGPDEVVSPLSARRAPPPPGQIRAGRVPLGHSKRSSISYRASASPVSPFSPGQASSLGAGSPATSPLASRTAARPSSGFFSPDMMAAATAGTSFPLSPPIDEERPISREEPAPTLIEQHGDLLSQIAEKERTCLDLREELKRHEDELKALKAQWEAAVARDVASARKAAAARRTPVSSPALSRQSSSQGDTTVSAAALTLGATDGLPAALLAVDDMPIQPAQLPDINSAKRWMGGLVKSATAGVSGILENLAAPLEQLPPPSSGSALGMVVEEEDEEPRAVPVVAPDSPASSSDETDRRASTSISDFFDDSKTRSSSVSSIESLSTGSSADTLKHDLGLSPMPLPEKQSISTPASWSGSSASSEAQRTPTPTQQPGGWLEAAEAEERHSVEEEQQSATAMAKHNRRRSTFDMLGQTASSWTGSLGRRWGEVTGSETFRTSKRATLSFVDTFERTLADAISIEADGSPRTDDSPSLSESAASPRIDAGSPALGTFGIRPTAPSTPTTPAAPTKRSDVTPKAMKLDVLSEESDGDGDIASSPLQPARSSPRPRLPAPIVPTTTGAGLSRVRAAHAKRMSMPVVPAPALPPDLMQTPEEEEWAKW